MLSFSSGPSSEQDLISVANTFLNDKSFVEAKDAIDDAFEDPVTVENPRAWYTKARVYHEILKNNDPELASLKQNYDSFIDQIVKAYVKTQQLTERSNNLHILATNQIEILWADGINAGVASFQKNDFKNALKSFQISKTSKPSDTLAYLYSGLSAQNAGLFEEAIENYMGLKTFTRLSKEVYNGIILSSQSMDAPYEDQLEYVEEALFEYPDHVPYIIQEVRLLIRLNRFLEAESILNSASLRNPDNSLLIIRKADLYDRIFKAAYINGEPERSERYYEKASETYKSYLSRYPDDFAANYNYSVMINEQANRVYVRINLMSKEEYQISGKEVEEIGHDWTRKALPYMEKAYETNPQDQKVTLALKVYYERLQMTEKLLSLDGKG